MSLVDAPPGLAGTQRAEKDPLPVRGPAVARGAVPAAGPLPLARLALSSSAETWLAIGVVVVVALLVIPLPPPVLDVLLATSFALSLLVLLVVLSARDPIEFSMFPSLLLLVTLFRLGLNVASTRLILSTGHAGQVIAAFGDFVIGGNIVVGLVIFLILVVINFVVITKGAGRIAEVAARFTLDAMPGRQMSIDADLSAGLIDETEARRRREEINRNADFYGAMDGAAKFVRGDAVAGIIITVINLVGGFIIGMAQRGMSAGSALTTYGSLTVGDGLVTQIPALIVSTGAGILVTYGSSKVAVAPQLGSQLTRSPRAMWTAAGILTLFAAVPGLPPVPFLVLGACSALVARLVQRRRDAAPDAAPADAAAPAATATSDLMAVDTLELEIGYGLIALADEAGGGDLMPRIGILRKQLALELGILVPPVRVRDNIQLPAHEYAIKIRGVRVAGAAMAPRQLLALDTTGRAGPLEGTPTRDPSFGIPARWIHAERRMEAEALGYAVVDPATVLTTHLMETIREHAAEILTRQDVRDLLDRLKETHPSLVEDTVPGRVPLGALHRVLQRLVREGIPVRDLVTVLEAVSDAAEQTKDVELMTEHVRRALSLTVAQMLRGDHAAIEAVMVGPRLEVALMQTFSPPRADAVRKTLDPDELTGALDSLAGILDAVKRDGVLPPLVTPPALRVGIRRLIEPLFPRLPVISLAELPPQTPIRTLKMWELNHEPADVLR